MGTFWGHALPGSFFIYFGLWAAYYQLKGFYSRRRQQQRGNSMVDEHEGDRDPIVAGAYPARMCRRLVPLDSILKLVLCLIGIVGEAWTGMDKQWHFIHPGNAQHITMYAFFALGGVYELIVRCGLFRAPVLLEQFCILLAMVAEAVLFLFHLHGRTPLNIYLHLLLAGMIVLAIAVGLMLLANPRKLIYGLVIVWTLLVQGTWFWQVGAILYPKTSWMPEWDEMKVENLPRAANLFCYHMLAAFIAILLLSIALDLHSRRRGGAVKHRPMPSNDNESSGMSNSQQELWTKQQSPPPMMQL